MTVAILNPNTPTPELLRAAARVALERPEPITLCDALSALLPRDEAGTEAWREAKNWLRLCLPDAFEGQAAWWRLEDREPRVLGALLAAEACCHSGNSNAEK